MRNSLRAGTGPALACLGLLLVTALASRAPAGEGRGFLVDPYLQNPGRTGITIMWISREAGGCAVRYGSGRALDREVKVKPALKADNDYRTDASPAYQKYIERRYGKRASELHGAHVYEARLTGLAPGTTYRYEVSSAGGKAGGSFRTSPGKPGPFTFIAYGDTRTNVDTHRKVAARFAKHQPAFIIHTGDMTEGEPYARWQKRFFKPLAGVIRDIPLWPARGNHEGRAVSYRQMFSLPGNELWYSFDYGTAHFVCLDSSAWRHPKTEAASVDAMCKWLEKDLAGSKATWKVAYYHEPTYDLGQKHRSKWGREKVLPILRRHRFDLAVSSHAHNYQRFKPIRWGEGKDAHCFNYVVCGSGGAPLQYVGNAPHMACRAYAHNYAVVKVDGGRLSAVVRDPDGKVIDTFTLSKKAGRPAPEYLARALPEKEFARLHGIHELVSSNFGDRTYLDQVPTRERPGRVTLSFGAGPHRVRFGINVAEEFRKFYEMTPVSGTTEPGRKVKLEVAVKAKVGARLKKRRLYPRLRLECTYEIEDRKGLFYSSEIRAGRK